MVKRRYDRRDSSSYIRKGGDEEFFDIGSAFEGIGDEDDELDEAPPVIDTAEPAKKRPAKKAAKKKRSTKKRSRR